MAVRPPDGRIHMKTQPNRKLGKWAKIPLVRGVVSFVMSLYEGTKNIDVFCGCAGGKLVGGRRAEEDKLDQWMKKRLSVKRARGIL